MRGTLILAAVATVLGLVAGVGAQATPPPRLVVRTVLATGGPIYIEGALSFVAVDKRPCRTIVTKQVRKRLVLRLAAGRYRLRSWVRPCDGNCGTLDAPTDRCARPFTLARGQTLVATIRQRPTTRCSITFRRA
jgi:hypothetical protein